MAIYRSPSQNNEQFKSFMDRLQITCDHFQRERPYSIIMTGDINCRSSQWWGEDIENLEGTALDELLETNSLYQLIDEPTKGQFPVGGIFRAGGILDNKKLLSRNYLFNFKATFSPTNNGISARSENSTDWKSALT